MAHSDVELVPYRMASYIARRLPDPKQQALLETSASQLGTAFAGHRLINELRAVVPFDSYAISGLNYPGLGVGAGVMLASDKPEAFLKAFLDQGLYRVDPMASLVSPSQNWASWHDLSQAELSRPELQAIRQLERQHGVTTRSVVGFYRGSTRFGGASFSRNLPFNPKEKLILEAVARMAHAELSAAFLERMSQHVGLSKGEIRCLAAIASGLALDAAAEATGYTQETVTTYIKAATRKLEARNRTHAVAEAIRRGLIV